MPRIARAAEGGFVYHILNRGNARMKLFRRDADYERFVELLREAQTTWPMRILGFVVMPTHWHLVLWPKKTGDLSRFMSWLSNTHVRRYHSDHPELGGGHLYQGRYRSFPVQPDATLLTVMRYVESNAKRSKLTKRAADWAWSSLAVRNAGSDADFLTPWPVTRPRNWKELIEKPLEDDELAALRLSVQRSRPLGDPAWTLRTVDRLGLESTMRPRGRPRKAAAK